MTYGCSHGNENVNKVLNCPNFFKYDGSILYSNDEMFGRPLRGSYNYSSNNVLEADVIIGILQSAIVLSSLLQTQYPGSLDIDIN